MRMLRLIGLVSAAVVLVAGVAAAQSETLNISAVTFTTRTDSEHNSFAPACGAGVSSIEGAEFHGTQNGSEGSFLAPLQLPNGAVVTSFRYFVRDFDSDVNSHAYLARKRTAVGTNAFTGYKVLAEAHSTGFDNAMRRFDDNSINNATIDNNGFSYFLEIVNCFSTMEPISVQIVFTP